MTACRRAWSLWRSAAEKRAGEREVRRAAARGPRGGREKVGGVLGTASVGGKLTRRPVEVSDPAARRRVGDQGRQAPCPGLLPLGAHHPVGGRAAIPRRLRQEVGPRLPVTLEGALLLRGESGLVPLLVGVDPRLGRGPRRVRGQT